MGGCLVAVHQQASGREPTRSCQTEQTRGGAASWTCTSRSSTKKSAPLEPTWPLQSNCPAIKSAPSPPLTFPFLCPSSLSPPRLPPLFFCPAPRCPGLSPAGHADACRQYAGAGGLVVRQLPFSPQCAVAQLVTKAGANGAGMAGGVILPRAEFTARAHACAMH